jgi:hypothetical protein
VGQRLGFSLHQRFLSVSWLDAMALMPKHQRCSGKGVQEFSPARVQGMPPWLFLFPKRFVEEALISFQGEHQDSLMSMRASSLHQTGPRTHILASRQKTEQKDEKNQSFSAKMMSRQIMRQRPSAEGAWQRGRLFGKRHFLSDK